MLVSATSSTPILAVAAPAQKADQTTINNGSAHKDVVSISEAAGAASQQTAPLPSAEQAADTMQGQFQTVKNLVVMLNDVKSALDNMTKPEMFTDDQYQKVLSDLHDMSDNLKKSISTGVQGLKDRYNASGDFPSEQSDGNWSQGNYAGSTSGKDYTLRATSNGGVLVSKNNQQFVKWSEQSSAPSTSENVALQIMKNVLRVDYET